MELTIAKTTAKKLYPESPEWFREVLAETFGKDLFAKKKFTDIKTFEDACEELNVDPENVFSTNDTSDEVAYKKLKIIVKAVNQGWIPDWSNSNQRKYWPYFNLSSGFGFSGSYYGYGLTYAGVGSRLCFESEEKSIYAAKQFIKIYEDLLTIKK